MRVLIACETSGTTRRAFADKGHECWSIDVLPSDDDSLFHIVGDAVEHIYANPWHYDLIIAHPPCTYLANSGARWLKDNPERQALMREAAQFFRAMIDAPAPRVAVENPVQHRHAMEAHGRGRADQYVQPWQFGHTEKKRTGLWLRSLPPLTPTTDLEAETNALPIREQQRIWYASPGEDRWKIRSKSFDGIARAMADQWG